MSKRTPASSTAKIKSALKENRLLIVSLAFVILLCLIWASSRNDDVYTWMSGIRNGGTQHCIDESGVKRSGESTKAHIRGVVYSLEVVRTDELIQQGLSYRDCLSTSTSGMLFAFEQSGEWAFWMKSMKFPIDIIWLNEDKEVIYIKENAEPRSYPNSFGPDIKSKYVIEIKAGATKKLHLKAGDKIDF